MEKLLAAFSPSFEHALRAGERMPPDRFWSFLTRIAENLYLKANPFTPQEESKLLRRFSLDATSLQALVAACSLVLQAAAEYNLTADRLRTALLSVTIAQPQADVFHAVWQDVSGDLCKRHHAAQRPVLTQSSWHLHVCAARGGSLAVLSSTNVTTPSSTNVTTPTPHAATAGKTGTGASKILAPTVPTGSNTGVATVASGGSGRGRDGDPGRGAPWGHAGEDVAEDVVPLAPVGVLDLRLQQGERSKLVSLEFTLDQLYVYHSELERIQEHLDAMT
eukprot:jgi/Mesvir1/3123/Mv05563-RA.1